MPTDAPLVLAVDDHPVNRRLLVSQLTALGLRVQSASSGTEALVMWRSGEYSVVISDCNMPEMDGYALAQAIRQVEAEDGRPRTPIIAWTANVLASAASQCHAAGMDDILTKPTDLTQLKETLSRWLSPLTLATRETLIGKEEETAAVLAAPIDEAQLYRIATSPTERNEIMLDFVGQTRPDVRKLGHALHNQDLVAAGQIAHRIKGASRIVGARALAALCETIEIAAHRGRLDKAAEVFENVDMTFEEAAVAYMRMAGESNKEKK